MEMNWQQKALAIQALAKYGDFSLKMRSEGNWYVSAQGVNRKEGAILSGSGISAGTPELAVVEYWKWATDPAYYLVKFEDGKRCAVKWNGFMWEDVKEEK